MPLSADRETLELLGLVVGKDGALLLSFVLGNIIGKQKDGDGRFECLNISRAQIIISIKK